MQRKGIDVSDHQGVINWDEVKKTDVEFAILRCGVGSNIKKQDDAQFERNYAECKRVGMPVGVYLYSYACNLDQAKSEVTHVLRLIEGKTFEYGIWFDMEDADGYKAKRGVSNATCTDICEYFCKEIESKGYYVGIYANLDWLRNRINDSRLVRFDKWVAQWSSKCTYDKNYGIWQYTSDGSVNGINGRVDMNYAIKDYPSFVVGTKTEVKEEEPQTQPEPAKQEPVKQEVTYKVKSGDTLSSIASKFGTTYQKIAEINGIANPNLIFAGQVLKIGAENKVAENEVYHIVKLGDSRWSLSKKYGVSIEQITNLNPQWNNKWLSLKVGAKLRIK